MVSYCIFLFAWFFPSGLYTEYIHEPDLMSLNPLALTFYTCCVAAFIGGSRASRLLTRGFRKSSVAKIEVRSPLPYLMIPMIVGIVLCCVYLIVLGGKINFVALLTSQQGNAIKAAGQVGQLETGRWSSALFVLTGILWWAQYRSGQISLSGTNRMIFRATFFTGAVIDLLTCVATVDRTNLMPLIAGLSIIWLFVKTRDEKVKIIKLLGAGLISGLGVVAIFLLVSMLRGDVAVRLLIMGLLGYTIVSYNRMAALLLGVMHDSYEGRGVFLFPILRENTTLNSIFHFSDRFGWPNSLSLWLSAFNSVSSAGLSQAFNYYSVPGALYSDLGWWTLAYMCGLGIISGVVWFHFKAGKTAAVILYPWCAFCILFWTGFNAMFDGRVLGILELALIMMVYDKVRVRNVRNAETTRKVESSAIAPMESASAISAGGFF
ncbi:MAG TPA: hypothetical protein VGR96_16675 [Acidobacteriaceae bacterium]|nr:hypothetical protein [Acidobacteriaceae bacterium]